MHAEKVKRMEEMIGGVVVVVGALFLAYSHFQDTSSSKASGGGVVVTAEFTQTDGMTVGADVRLSGMPIGAVEALALNPNYRSLVTLRLRDDIALPIDTAAVIRTDGMLGGKFLELEPGGSDQMLKSGDRIEYTQGAVVVEELLGKIVDMAKATKKNAAPPAEDGATDPVGEPQDTQ